MREVQGFIGQGVGNHIVFSIDVIHSPMNTALSEGVAERYASAKVWPQVRGTAGSLPPAKDDHLARQNLGVQFEYHHFINVGPSKRPLHAVLETHIFGHVARMPVV